MTDGPSLSLQGTPPLQDNREYIPPPDIPGVNLTTFMLWIELQPLSTITGMLELLGNELYRQARFSEGHELKHVAQTLREESPPLTTQRKRQMQPHPLETGYHGRVHDEDPTCHAVNSGDISCQPVSE